MISRLGFGGDYVQITFYNNLSQNNVVDKELANGLTLNGDILEPYDEYAPRIRMTSSIGDRNYMLSNGLYYYVENVTRDLQGIYHISCRLDVLMSYSDYIRDMYGYVVRTGKYSGADIHPFVPDNRDVNAVYKNVQKYEFPEAMGFAETESGGCYILITSQKGYTTS